MSEKKSVFGRLAAVAIIDRNFCWSFLGWIVGVISLVVAIYFGMFYKTTPRLALEITTNTNIVDIKEDPKKLDIVYDGKSLKSVGSTLSVVTLRIVNEGNSAVKIDAYTPDAPLGFTVTGGEVIEAPQVIDASNTYLREKLKASLIGKDKVVLAPAIFNAGDYIGFKLLVIHRGGSDDPIEFQPIGTIADTGEIAVRQGQQLLPSKPLWRQVMEGGFAVQVVRAVFYIVVLFVLLIVVAVLVGIVHARLAKKRQRTATPFLNTTVPPRTPAEQHFAQRVTNIYITNGAKEVQRIVKLLNRLATTGNITGPDIGSLVSNGVFSVGMVAPTPGTSTFSTSVPPEMRKVYSQFLEFLNTL
jgi:uncharacterized membrane protein